MRCFVGDLVKDSSLIVSLRGHCWLQLWVHGFGYCGGLVRPNLPDDFDPIFKVVESSLSRRLRRSSMEKQTLAHNLVQLCHAVQT
jgi:hypothetical protein